MNELALFAGAGGGILGGKLLGWRTVCAVERDAYAAAVLAQRQTDGHLDPFPIWSDIETFDGRPWRGLVDVVSGGFPCQDTSCAGKGAGITGERSGLWAEMARVVREVGPRFVFVENSPMLTIRGLGTVLGDLAEMGFDAQWGVLGAVHVGAIHKRERIWVLCSNSKGIRRKRSREIFTLQEKNNANRIRFEKLLESEARVAISAGKYSRKSDVISNRVDRLKAIGNGQVPAVVRLAWSVLNGMD